MLLLLTLLSASAPDSPRLQTLARSVAAADATALREFWESVAREGTPMIEPLVGANESLVTFLYRGDSATRSVLLVGGPKMSLSPNDNAFELLQGTDVWYRSYRIRRDARFTYKFNINADTAKLDIKDMPKVMRWFGGARLDSLNARRFPAGPVPALYLNSVVELPDAPKQQWIARRPGPQGTLDSLNFPSTVLGNERMLTVYTPSGYDKAKGPYRLLLVFDREAYLGMVPTPTVLDNLINAARIPPLVAVLISNPGDLRSAELPCNRKFADFLAQELIPWARDKYAAGPTPDLVTTAGSSYGGLASTCAALFHPEAVGNVVSQSGSYWWPDFTAEKHEWVFRQFESASKLPIRFYQDVGLMEDGPTPGDGPSMVASNRRLRDLLKRLGYEVHYAEFNGGHEYLNWQETLADGLLALHGRK